MGGVAGAERHQASRLSACKSRPAGPALGRGKGRVGLKYLMQTFHLEHLGFLSEESQVYGLGQSCIVHSRVRGHFGRGPARVPLWN